MSKLMEVVNKALDSRIEAWKESKCIPPPMGCGKDVSFKDFRDEKSWKEYGMSGWCQECQDKFFEEQED
jgi:hypothetical protein